MKNELPAYVEVAPVVPLKPEARQTYTYRLLDDKEKRDHRYTLVTIPFGKRSVTGTIMASHDSPPAYPVKIITRLLPARLTEEQVAYAQWIARTMQGGVGFTLRLFYPPGNRGIVQNPPAPRRRNEEDTMKDGTVVYVESTLRKRAAMIARRAVPELQKGGQVLIIVPEKWMIDRLEATLPDAVQPYRTAVHAERKLQELKNIWSSLSAGEPRLVIGTQKALFLPYRGLTTIVIEEEQLTTHKLWDQYPRLHNVYAAHALAALHHARIVYATSFPSLRLEHLRQVGQLAGEGKNSVSPQVTLLPLTFSDKNQRRALPETGLQIIRQGLKNNERILLFYNRRGSWQAALCTRCKRHLRCPTCNAGVAVHNGALRCHHCGWGGNIPQRCPSCNRGAIKTIGLGTEKIATLLQRLVQGPHSMKQRITHIDKDTVEKFDRALLKKNSGYVVIGTTAIFTALSGITFDRIMWLYPERSLLYPDIRSEERSYLLLARLQQFYSPRSRRRIILVTRQPYVLEQTLALPRDQFVKKQLIQRKRFGYPPFNDLIRLTVAGATDTEALKKGHTLRSELEKRQQRHHPAVKIILRGPFQSFVKRRKGKAEAHILLLGPLSHLVSLYDGLPLEYVDLAPERIL